jgi:hypothetical protein
MGRRTLSRKEAEQILRDKKGNMDALRRLPADVDPSLAAGAVTSLLDGPHKNGWAFGRSCQQLPTTVVREVLAYLSRAARTADNNVNRDIAIFVTALVSPELPDARLAEAWQAALAALLDLNTSYGWGSKQRKAKIRGVAVDAKLVAAVQTVAVGCEDTSLDMLAVLCSDGSDASFDALMPHFDRAERSGERLEWLGMLRKHANLDSEPIRNLLDTAAARLAALSCESPAVALAAFIGLGQPKVFWFDAYLGSTELNRSNVPLYQGHIRVDSRSPNWFSVWVTRVSSTLDRAETAFRPKSPQQAQQAAAVEVEGGGAGRGVPSRRRPNNMTTRRDDLELGTCAAEEIPRWLQQASEKLGIDWSVSLRTSLRGKKRQVLEDWLTSG